MLEEADITNIKPHYQPSVVGTYLRMKIIVIIISMRTRFLADPLGIRYTGIRAKVW